MKRIIAFVLLFMIMGSAYSQKLLRYEFNKRENAILKETSYTDLYRRFGGENLSVRARSLDSTVYLQFKIYGNTSIVRFEIGGPIKLFFDNDSMVTLHSFKIELGSAGGPCFLITTDPLNQVNRELIQRLSITAISFDNDKKKKKKYYYTLSHFNYHIVSDCLRLVITNPKKFITD